jgi:hypothetical protein
VDDDDDEALRDGCWELLKNQISFI